MMSISKSLNRLSHAIQKYTKAQRDLQEEVRRQTRYLAVLNFIENLRDMGYDPVVIKELRIIAGMMMEEGLF